MQNKRVDDDFLYKHMGNTEDVILNNLPKEDNLSHDFSKKFVRKMDRLLKEEKNSPLYNRLVPYGRKIAIVSIIVISLILASNTRIENHRLRFSGKVFDILENYTSISLYTDESFEVEYMNISTKVSWLATKRNLDK